MDEREPDKKRRRRLANVYDSVAGRVTSEGFLRTEDISASKDARLRSQTAVRPEEVLYRRKDAPTRFAEDDTYFQHRHLSPDQPLPSADLLKIVHAYAADFYARTSEDGGIMDQKSFDETALIAIGILLEEAASNLIGKTGHLALLENS